MGFLSDLADQIDSQLSVGENTSHTLDAVVDGQNQKYGALGDFAKKFDQSAERRYVEDGFLRKDPFNTDPKQFEVLMQEPSATVLVKKRMFSSINENYRPDYMDADEKLYFKAMKVLFQNKCRQIAALEKLSKIQKITSGVGNISEQLMPIIISLTDDAGSGFSAGGPGWFGQSQNSLFGQINSNGDVAKFTQVIDRVRRLYAFNNTNPLTSWITDPTNLFQSQFGQGTGTIEITNFTNISTTVTTDIKSPGSFNLTISDPYEAMLITEYDIERALSDATNSFYNHKIYQFGQTSADQIIADTTARLNQLRSLRKVSPITFKINPDTLLGRRVIAIVDRQGVELPFTYDSGFGGIGGGVDVAPEYLVNGSISVFESVLGIDGLDTQPKSHLGPDSNIKALYPESELSVFGRLVTAIFSKMQLEANSRGAFVTTNKNTNYARRKLRFNFSGKLIIQPMDTVHIYMNSKSRFDTKLLGGLQNMFTGAGILQNLNKSVTDLKNAFDTVFNPGGSVTLQAEKAAFVGPDFPNYLWSLLRNQFVSEKEGTHVFAGIVQSAVDNWNDGKFMIDVRGSDNTAYFDMGKVNFKPGVDVFNGALFDPLTPFKSKFDTISSNTKDDSPDLLDENKFLLGSSQDKNSPIVKFKLGPNVGQAAYQDNVFQDIALEKATRSLSKVFYAPDGLVYKWKEGIGTFVQFGDSTSINDPFKVGTPPISADPFAGQDVMNVLSLLVTGQPYNFANYWRAASNFDGFMRDPQSQQDAAHSYYDSLRADLEKNNVIWGNFIPFKNLSLDEKSFAEMMKGQFRVIQANKDIEVKLKKLSDALQYANIFGSDQAISFIDPDQSSKFKAKFNEANNTVDTLKSEINKLIQAVSTDDTTHSALTQFGSDTSFDSTAIFGGDGKGENNDSTRRALRRQLNFLTRRMSYNVRANEDKNLFIVDDTYDKDYDLIAYQSTLSEGLKLFNNEFNSVKDKIISTAQLLNLEVFADTQGHIRIRSPQYNRMPASVFYRMMYLKKSTGVQVFPQFLDDLFGDQIKSLKEKIEILEDQIRLDCCLIGVGATSDDIDNDTQCQDFINTRAENAEQFLFVSNTTGEIADLFTTAQNAHPNDINEASVTFESIKDQSSLKRNIFDNTQRYSTVLDALTKKKLDLAGYGISDIKSFNDNTRIDDLISRIQTKSGMKIKKEAYLLSTDILGNRPDLSENQAIDVFKVTQELADKIRDRQKTLKLFYSALKNSIEFKSLDEDPDNTSSSILTPGVYGNSHIPEVFEHMIEDESYDDYGLNSGKRYIIKRAQIRSLSISENPPDFTMVEVQGRIDPLISNSSLPSDLNAFPAGGNSLVTAAAIDYDMWRNYGFRQVSPINVPFLNDPNAQCAPYASMILSQARKNILRGTVTISGNEFMQPGEVVFLEDRGMLFYVNSVRHAYSEGNSFTTTLDLTYGHTPGEYIPTTLDVIGKLIYNNRDTTGVIIQRQTNSLNDKSVGVCLRDKKTSSSILNTGDKEKTVNSFSAANTQTINNMLFNTSYIINANNTKGNTIKASIELRVYCDSGNDVDSDLMDFAKQVQAALTSANTGPKQPFNAITSSLGNAPAPTQDVNIVPVSLDDDTEKRSPSQRAIDAARNMVNNNSMSNLGGSLPGSSSVAGFGSAVVGVGSAVKNTFTGGDGNGGTGTNTSTDFPGINTSKDKIRSALYKYVVDCWVKLEQVTQAEAQANNG